MIGAQRKPMTLRRAWAIDRLAKREMRRILPLLRLALYAKEFERANAQAEQDQLAAGLRYTEHEIERLEAQLPSPP